MGFSMITSNNVSITFYSFVCGVFLPETDCNCLILNKAEKIMHLFGVKRPIN